MELQLSRVSQVRHCKKDYGQICLSDAGGLFCWCVFLDIMYYIQPNQALKYYLTKSRRRNQQLKIIQAKRQRWRRRARQPTGQGGAEAETRVRGGAQHGGVGGINLLKETGLAPRPTYASRSLADLPQEPVPRAKLHQSDGPATAADQREQPAHGRPRLLGKGEEEARVTPLTPQLICLRGLSHAMYIRLPSSTEISRDNK